MLTLLILIAGLQVHEWGVLTQNPLSFTGAMPGENPIPDELTDKAPVVYFHGDPCTISLRITFPEMGYATQVAPGADQGSINSTFLVWENLVLTQDIGGYTEGWLECSYLGYPFQAWRQVSALNVINRNNYDKFIYYECVPGNPGDLPFISQSGNQPIRMPYGEIPCVVLASSGGRIMYGVFTLADIASSIPKGMQFLDDPASLRRELLRWSDGVLFEDEFNAFWTTWESQFLADAANGVFILYRVPEEVVEQIAAMEITSPTETEISINRFIIAELPYRTQ
jgi:hypothetical protein